MNPLPHWEVQELQPGIREAEGHASWLRPAAESTSEALRRALSREEAEDPQRQQELPARVARQLHMDRDSIAVSGPGLPRLVHWVLGRPTLWFQLGHGGMQPEEKVPYLASVFAPAPVTLLLGRWALQTPTCPRNEAVWHNWHDLILPVILSPALPGDTLCVVFESDFRLSQEHAEACRAYEQGSDGWTWVRGAGGSSASTQPAAAPAEAQAASLQRGRGTPRAKPWKTRKAPADRKEVDSTPFLLDLVSMCNQAQKRHGRGDLVWISYLSASKKGKSQPSRASTCIAISKAGAMHLLNWMNSNSHPDHFDVMLADALAGRKPGLEELAEHASFVSPSRGGFQEHLSGCETNLLRTEEWSKGEPYLRQLPGTKTKEIWLARWGQPFSNECWLSRVSAAEEEGQWKTLRPAALRGTAEEKRAFLLEELGQPDPLWVEQEFFQSAEGREASGSAGSAGPGPASGEHSALEVLDVFDPDWGDDVESVISCPDSEDERRKEERKRRRVEAGLRQSPALRKSAPEPVDPEFIGVAVEQHNYRKRLRRKAVHEYYKFRVFTDNEACLPCATLKQCCGTPGGEGLSACLINHASIFVSCTFMLAGSRGRAVEPAGGVLAVVRVRLVPRSAPGRRGRTGWPTVARNTCGVALALGAGCPTRAGTAPGGRDSARALSRRSAWAFQLAPWRPRTELLGGPPHNLVGQLLEAHLVDGS